MQQTYPLVLPEKVYQVSVRGCSKSSQRKPANHKKTSRDSILKQFSLFLSREIHWEAKERFSGTRKRVATHKSLYFFLRCLDMEQFFTVPVSVKNNNNTNKSLKTQAVTKYVLPKYQDEQNPTYQIHSSEKKTTKSWLPNHTLKSTNFCLVLVSSSQIR